jgi:hypothetical protein
MAKNRLFMETTKIHAHQSADEIVRELVSHGARSINTDYDDGRVVGLRWVMRVSGSDVLFDMPARVDAVRKLLMRETTGSARRHVEEKAERIAWRQLLRWVQAQLAFIDCGMAQTAEVFMPYMVLNPGSNKRLFDMLMDQQFKALPAPEAQ